MFDSARAAEMVDRFAVCAGAQRAAVAAELRAIAEFDACQRSEDQAAGLGERLAGRTVAVQVALTLGVSATAAMGRVAFARALVDELPAVLDLLGDGLVSEWHARTVVAATEQLAPAQRLLVGEQVAAQVRTRAGRGVKPLTAYELGEAAARRAIAIDPDAATARYERARRVRQVSVTSRVDGTAALWMKGPAEQTQHLYDEVERDARVRRHDGDPRSLDEIMFDQIYESVLAAMPAPAPDPLAPVVDRPAATGISRALAVGDLAADDPAQDSYADTAGIAAVVPPARRLVARPRRVEAQVVIAVSTALGLDEQPALLRGYGAIPAEIARQIADTTTSDGAPGQLLVRRLLCDPVDGRLVNMESSARLFTGPLRQFAVFRDQTCRLTSGPVRDLDHIHPHQHAGPTSAANAQALAKNPHVLREHPAITVRTRAPGHPWQAHAPDVEWTFPTGHTYRSEPPPALGHGSTTTRPTSAMELKLNRILRCKGGRSP